MSAACNIYDLREERLRNIQSPSRKEMESTDFSRFALDYLDIVRSDRKDYKAYVNAIEHFKSFEQYKGRKFQTRQIGCDLLIQFHSYCQINRGLKQSTTAGIITKIKYLLKRAYDEGWNVNNSFRETRITSGETFSIALSQKEIDQIYFCKELTSQNEEIRDMFVFLCQTGLRYSDAIKVRPEHFNGDVIVKKTKKTKVTVYVPVDSYVKEILERYGGVLPQARTAQHFNYAIKKICEIAGLTKEITYETEEAGEVVMKKVRKCDIISSHTGRRSYVTNQFKKGNGVEKIQPVTGHQSLNCLMRYNKQSKEDNARALAIAG